VDAGQIVVRLLADAKGVIAGASQGTAALRGYAASAKSIGQNMVAVGRGMTKYITLPILALGAAAAKLSLDFQKPMTDIEALVGMTAKQVAKVKREILAMAPDVARSPQELAEAYYFIASSGLKGASAMKALRASAIASAAGLGETKVIADAVTSAINAYGEENLSATKAVDILTAAVREGKAEPDQFAGAIGRVIPVAQAMGVSFGEVAGTMAALSLNGTDANEAVTQITAGLSAAIKPTKQGVEALKSVDMTYADLRKQIADKGLITVFNELSQAFGGNVEQVGKVFGNVRALRGEMTLTGPSAKKYAKIVREVAGASGDAARAAAIALEKPGAKLQRAWVAIQASLIKAGDIIVPVLAKVADAVTKVAQAFDRLPEGTQSSILKLLALAAVAGPVVLGIGKITLGVLKLTSALRGVGAAAGAAGALGGLPGAATGAGGLFPGVAGAGTTSAGAAAMGMAPLVAAAVAALSPILVATVMTKTQKYTEGRTGAAATSQQNKGAGGAFYGSSKGYGGGSAGYQASQAARAAASYKPIVQRLDVVYSKSSWDQAQKMRRTIELIQTLGKKGIDIDFTGMAKKGPAALNAIKDQLMETLHLTEGQARRVMDNIAKAFGNKKLKFSFDEKGPKAAAKIVSDITGKVRGIVSASQKAGKDASAKLASGLASGVGPTRAAAKQLGAAARPTVASTYSLGASLASGLIQGMAAKMNQVRIAGRNLGTAASGGVHEGAGNPPTPSSITTALGISLAAGLTKGMAKGLLAVVKQGTLLGLAAAKAINAGIGTKAGRAKVAAAAETSGAISTLVDFISGISESLANVAKVTIPTAIPKWQAAVRAVIAQARQFAAYAAQQLNKAFPWTKATKKREAKVGSKGQGIQNAAAMAGPVGEMLSFIVDTSELLRTIATSTVPAIGADMKANVANLAKAVAEMASVVASALVTAFPKAKTTGKGKNRKTTGGEALANLMAAAEIAGPAGSVAGLMADTIGVLQTMSEVDPRLFEPPAGAWARIGSIITSMVAEVSGALTGVMISDQVLTAASRIELLANALMSVLDVMKAISDVDAGNYGTAGWSNLVAAAGGMVTASASLPGISGTGVTGTAVAAAASGGGGDTIILQLGEVKLMSGTEAEAKRAGLAIGTEAARVLAKAKRSTKRGGGKHGRRS